MTKEKINLSQILKDKYGLDIKTMSRGELLELVRLLREKGEKDIIKIKKDNKK